MNNILSCGVHFLFLPRKQIFGFFVGANRLLYLFAGLGHDGLNNVRDIPYVLQKFLYHGYSQPLILLNHRKRFALRNLLVNSGNERPDC